MRDGFPEGIDYRFSDEELLEEALTHRSRGRNNYERLEFLGDSVLNLVVSDRLYEYYPDAREGELSRMRARIVRGETLAKLAVGLDLGRHVKLGEGELKSGGFRRQSILADALEALFGAIYLDGGFEACRKVILDLCDPLVSDLPDIESLKDPKTRLQEWLQARGRPLPIYEFVSESGADHEKSFVIRCRLQDSGDAVTATGSSLQKAEQEAAGSLVDRLTGAGAE